MINNLTSEARVLWAEFFALASGLTDHAAGTDWLNRHSNAPGPDRGRPWLCSVSDC